MKIKVYTHPSSLRAVKIKVASLNAKLDEKPVRLRSIDPAPSDVDGHDQIKDDMYTLLKNDEIENPYADDRSV